MNINAKITGQIEANAPAGSVVGYFLNVKNNDTNVGYYYVAQDGNNVNITSNLGDISQIYHLNINYKPTSWSVSNGHSGYTYVGDVWPTATSHYIKLTIGGKHYYLDCKGL